MRRTLGTLSTIVLTSGLQSAWAGDVSPTDVPTVHQVPIVFPAEARREGIQDASCKANVWLSPTGRPESIDIVECPRVFHTELRRSLLQWRWEKQRRDEEKVSRLTSVQIRFSTSESVADGGR